MKIALILIFLTFSYSSSAIIHCFRNQVVGTYPGIANSVQAPPMYAAFAGAILNSERDPVDDSDRRRKDIIAYSSMAIGLGLVFSQGLTCTGVSRESYEKQLNERKKLIASGEDVSKLKPLPVLPSRIELESIIKAWKKRQRKLQSYFAPISLALQTSTALEARKFGTQAFATLSALGTLALVLFDVDKLRNEENPVWVDFSILTTRVNNKVLPSPTLTFTF